MCHNSNRVETGAGRQVLMFSPLAQTLMSLFGCPYHRRVRLPYLTPITNDIAVRQLFRGATKLFRNFCMDRLLQIMSPAGRWLPYAGRDLSQTSPLLYIVRKADSLDKLGKKNGF
jgi:hypothetical protein